MPGASLIVVIGLGTGSATDAIATARPQLVPTGTTTRALADSATASAHPTHLEGSGYRVDTVCDRSYCVEELRVGRKVLIAATAALAALRGEVSDPGHEDQTDATEVILPQPSPPGYLSLYRLESDFTEGAAHARSSGRCETYAIATGKRVTLREVYGATRARRIMRAAHAADGTTRDAPATTDFLIPADGTLTLCGAPDAVGPAPDPITITVPMR